MTEKRSGEIDQRFDVEFQDKVIPFGRDADEIQLSFYKFFSKKKTLIDSRGDRTPFQQLF